MKKSYHSNTVPSDEAKITSRSRFGSTTCRPQAAAAPLRTCASSPCAPRLSRAGGSGKRRHALHFPQRRLRSARSGDPVDLILTKHDPALPVHFPRRAGPRDQRRCPPAPSCGFRRHSRTARRDRHRVRPSRGGRSRGPRAGPVPDLARFRRFRRRRSRRATRRRATRAGRRVLACSTPPACAAARSGAT